MLVGLNVLIHLSDKTNTQSSNQSELLTIVTRSISFVKRERRRVEAEELGTKYKHHKGVVGGSWRKETNSRLGLIYLKYPNNRVT